MKKLILKKDIVARINNSEMTQLKGGADTYNICQTIIQATCTAAQTCAPNVGCGDASNGCLPPQGTYTGTGPLNTGNCNTGGGVTQDICGLSHMVSQCDTCYIRCNP